MRHGAILLVVVVGLAACAEEVRAPRAEGDLDLQGDWRLESGTHRGEQIALVAGYPITLTIEGEEASGRSACNMYGGSVRVGGSSVSFSDLAGTEMGCRRDVMDAEEAYLAALGSVHTAARDGGALVLLGPEAELRFAAVSPVPRAALTGTPWVLDSLLKNELAISVRGEPTLELSRGGSLSATTGCRTLEGAYVVEADEVRVTELSAEGSCPPHLRDQDDHVVSVLGDGFRVRIAEQRLTLISMGDLGLVYRAP